MNLLNKLTIKNLKLNKKRTFVTIIGIMLSVALITTVASIYVSAVKSLINFEIIEKGNFHVAYYDVPISEINIFKNNRAIETINLTQNIGYAKIDSKNEYKPYAFVKGFTKNSLENLSIKLIEGNLPQNENEILIPTHLKTNGRLELNVGDTITLDVGKRVDSDGYELNQYNPYNYDDNSQVVTDVQTGEEISSIYDKKSNESIIDIVSKTYKIVGIIERPSNNIEQYTAPGYTFVTYMDENNISGNVDLFARYTKDGTKNVYKVTADLLGVDENLYKKMYDTTTQLSEEEYTKLYDEISKSKYQIDINTYLIGLETNPLEENGGMGQFGAVAGFIMVIIVFTSVFCIKNSFDISITEKIKQYGMLRCIGATKKQIRKNVFYEATILGLIGIPLGILLGFLASFLLIIISNYYLKDMLTTTVKLVFSFSFISVVIAIVLGIITIYFSAFRSAIRASKVYPIDYIRNSASIKIKAKKVKSSKIVKKLFGMGGDISYKNLKRNKKKYRTTVISIIVSVSIFIALSSFIEMGFDTVQNEIETTESNIYLSSNNYSDDSYDKFVETTKFDNIEDFTILRESSFRISSDLYSEEYIDWIDLKQDTNNDVYLEIVALGDEQYSKYIDKLGLEYDDIKDKGILLDYTAVSKYDEEKNKNIDKYMRIFDINKGDIVSGTLYNDNNFNLEIGLVTKETPFGFNNTQDGKLIISDELFDKIALNEILTIYYKSDNPNQLQDDIDEYLKSENYYLTNIEEQAKMMNNLITLIGIFLYGFIIVISLIGITNIFNTITTNMELRKQEFAMLKSVGMTMKEFNRMIRLESIFIGLRALFIGIPLGIILSYVIYHLLTQNTIMPYKLPLLAILIAIITIFILISIIMKYSINKINKQNIIETIRNENI